MSVSRNDFHGLWRASANEGVPYSEDFPEALLTLPEFIDNSLGAGGASVIDIKFNITNPSECEFSITDNGKGLVSEKRMKEWSSKDVGSNSTENIYGHGAKKALSKFAPEYSTATWKMYWRKQDRRGLVGALNVLSSPYNGLETTHIEDDKNDDICPDHGTRLTIKFDIKVFGRFDASDSLMGAVQELIRVRYEPSQYQPYTINVKVINGTAVLEYKSTEMKSLRECLEAEIPTNVKKIYERELVQDKTIAHVSFYEIVTDGRSYNIAGLPTFGRKNMKASRVHIARHGRYIEAMPIAKFLGKEEHNSLNGKIGFIRFTGEELPTPCTTKVKMYEECPVFKKMITLIRKNVDPIITKMAVKAPVTVIVKAAGGAPQAAGGAPAAVKEPPTTAKAPAAVKESPTTAKAPAAVKEPPTTAKAPAAVKEPPTTAKEPAAVKEPPTTAKAPAAVKESPTTAKEPAAVKEPPKAIAKEEAIDNSDHETLKNLRAKYGKDMLIRLLQETGV
jgi:hypothetical protein